MMEVYEIKNFTDDEGKLITAKIPIDERKKTSGTKYIGTYTIPNGQGGGHRCDFEFPADWLLEKCFEQFKSQAEADYNLKVAAAQKHKAEADAKTAAAGSKIWTPQNEGNNSGLIVP